MRQRAAGPVRPLIDPDERDGRDLVHLIEGTLFALALSGRVAVKAATG